MTRHANNADEHGQRFRDAALPWLDDAYTLAHFIMRNQADAEDAVQECYLRALRHFDGFRGDDVKPWLFTILRNVCYRELARRGRRGPSIDLVEHEDATHEPLWQEPQAAPDALMFGRQDSAAIRELVSALPEPFREAIVLREFNDMSYRDIAAVAGVPMGTVMSRLARARAMLLAAWKAMEDGPQPAPVAPRPAPSRASARSAARDAKKDLPTWGLAHAGQYSRG